MRYLFLVASVLTHCVLGLVQEEPRMKDALAAAKPGTLLILDLDNTVMRPAQMLGSDEDFESRAETRTRAKMKAGTVFPRAFREAVGETLVEWSQVHRHTRMVPVEPQTPEWIRLAQADERKLTVMALTARPSSMAESSLRELKDLGVDFTLRAPISRDLVFPDKEAHFIGGVLFIGPHGNKGKRISEFFQLIGKTPERIVFVDDKKKNVESLEAAFKNTKIDYLGFRYSAADNQVRSYRREVADEQLANFLFLSDENAALLIKMRADKN